MLTGAGRDPAGRPRDPGPRTRGSGGRARGSCSHRRKPDRRRVQQASHQMRKGSGKQLHILGLQRMILLQVQVSTPNRKVSCFQGQESDPSTRLAISVTLVNPMANILPNLSLPWATHPLLKRILVGCWVRRTGFQCHSRELVSAGRRSGPMPWRESAKVLCWCLLCSLGR